MKKSCKTVLTAAIAVIIILTAVSAAFSYLALVNDYDHDIRHFDKGSVSAAIGMYLPIAASIIALACSLFIRKKLSFSKAPESGAATVFTSVLTGLLMIAFAALTVAGGGEISKITYGVIITAALSGIYFLLLPFLSGRTFMAYLAFAPALWSALKLLEEYFRDGDPINSPVRIVNLTMFAFLLLFFSEEVRFGIGRQLVGSYYFCALSAVAFTGAAVFPKLAVILTGAEGFDFVFMDWCLCAAVFLFILARLASLPPVLCERIPASSKQEDINSGGANAVSTTDESTEKIAETDCDLVPDSDNKDNSAEEKTEDKFENENEEADEQ